MKLMSSLYVRRVSFFRAVKHSQVFALSANANCGSPIPPLATIGNPFKAREVICVCSGVAGVL
jgi:hypothetical protein